MNPQELPDWEESHYYHTIQDFNALVRSHGPKQVLDDLKNLDPLTYETIVVQCIATESKKKQTAAIFKDFNANQD